MPIKYLGQLEEHAAFMIFIAVIVILLWHGIWALTDELQHYLERRFGLNRIYFNVMSIMLVVLIIGLHPQMLEKL
jgi:hypothetical protein